MKTPHPARRWFSVLGLAIALVLPSVATAQPYHTYYGLLHAHTRFSDGSGTPAEAYTMSRAAGVQFFAVTPHNHASAEMGAKERADGILIATVHGLYESSDSLSIPLPGGGNLQAVSVLRAAREATTATFAALYGQEFSTISSGNHMNVIGYDQVLTNPNGDFRSLFLTLDEYVAKGHPAPIVQLNHPDVQADLFYAGQDKDTLKAMFNDYGFDDFGGDFRELVAAAEKYVVLIELLSGPAMAKNANPAYHYDDPHEDDYYFYLTQGFHLSPSAGQDNHYKTWGVSSSARMGVLASDLTQTALFEAMRANRTFASEDKNLSVKLLVNDALMGSCLELPAGADLNISVLLSDEDEPNADYAVTLVHGAVAPQQRSNLSRRLVRDGETGTGARSGNGAVTFDASVSGQPEFFYVRVKQEGVDRAWSAPVWINHPRAGAAVASAQDGWVWTASSSSTVYHHDWCKVAGTIAPQNRRSGTTPPANRTLHNCQRAEPPPEP